MTGFAALLRKDLRLSLSRPSVFAFVALFAVSAGALTFYTGRFFDANRANLTTLFVFLPWLFVLFTPALAMETLSAERRSGTAELLFALPLKTRHIILAKWLSMWLICLFALALTMTLWLSVTWLGTPDHGAIIVGYFGMALVAGCYCALSLAASARTSSHVLAFLGALSLNTLVTIGALPVLKRLPDPYAHLLADFSVPLHQAHFLRGVISLNDVIFFISLTMFGVFVAGVLWRKARMAFIQIALAMIAVLALNTFLATGPLQSARLDMTEERLYTLSPAARSLIKGQSTPNEWVFYYSRTLAANYPDIRELGAQIEESLHSFADASNGNIRLTMIDPGFDNPREDRAIALGMEALPTDRGEPLYIGLADETGALISRFDPARINALEYDLVRALDHNANGRTKIALYDGIDLAGRDWFVTGRKGSLAFEQINTRYDVALLGDDFVLDDLTDHILMLVHPPAFNQTQDQAISDFIAQGGRALIFLDPYSETSARPALSGLPKTGARMASIAPGFLVSMGLGWSSTKIVLDRDSAMPVQRNQNGKMRTLRQPAWIGIPPARLIADNPVTTHLQRGLIMASAAIFNNNPEMKWSPLVITSQNTALLEARDFAMDPDPAALMTTPPSTDQSRWLGVQKDGVIVMGDADMLDDDYYVQVDPVFGKRAQSDNARFVLNALDWLTGADALLTLRSRATIARTLSRIDAMRAHAEQQLRKAEQGAGPQPDGAAQKSLRAVRQQFHRQISRFESLLEIINIGLAPLLVLMLGGILSLWRKRKSH